MYLVDVQNMEYLDYIVVSRLVAHLVCFQNLAELSLVCYRTDLKSNLVGFAAGYFGGRPDYQKVWNSFRSLEVEYMQDIGQAESYEEGYKLVVHLVHSEDEMKDFVVDKLLQCILVDGLQKIEMDQYQWVLGIDENRKTDL